MACVLEGNIWLTLNQTGLSNTSPPPPPPSRKKKKKKKKKERRKKRELFGNRLGGSFCDNADFFPSQSGQSVKPILLVDVGEPPARKLNILSCSQTGPFGGYGWITWCKEAEHSTLQSVRLVPFFGYGWITWCKKSVHSVLQSVRLVPLMDVGEPHGTRKLNILFWSQTGPFYGCG